MIEVNRTNERPDSSVTVTMAADDWSQILMDLRHGRDWFELEPESEDLFEALAELGVK